MMLERGVQPQNRHVVRLEGFMNAPCLRDGYGDRIRAQNLKGDQGHDASTQRSEAQWPIRVEPGLHREFRCLRGDWRHRYRTLRGRTLVDSDSAISIAFGASVTVLRARAKT